MLKFMVVVDPAVMTKASVIGTTNPENVLSIISASTIDNVSPLKCTPPAISTLMGKEDYDSSATVSSVLCHQWVTRTTCRVKRTNIDNFSLKLSLIAEPCYDICFLVLRSFDAFINNSMYLSNVEKN